MTKQEYFYSLKKGLRYYAPDFQEEILSSFEEHFENGISEGKSEAEIIAELGDPNDVIRDIHAAYGGQRTVEEKTPSFTSALKSVIKSVVNDYQEYIQSERSESSITKQEVIGNVDSDSFVVDVRNLSLDISLHSGDQLAYQLRFTRGNGSTRLSWPDGKIMLSIEADKERFMPYGQLELTVPKDIRHLYINNSSGDLEAADLELDELIIHALSGDVDLESLQVGEISLKTTSGDMSLNDSHYDKASLQCYSGDLDLDNCQGELRAETLSGDIDIDDYSGKIQAKTTSGDIDVSVEQLADIHLEAVSGDIDLVVPNYDFTATCQSVSGDVDLSLDEDVPFGRLSAHKAIVGNGSYEIVLKSVSGDVRLSD